MRFWQRATPRASSFGLIGAFPVSSGNTNAECLASAFSASNSCTAQSVSGTTCPLPALASSFGIVHVLALRSTFFQRASASSPRRCPVSMCAALRCSKVISFERLNLRVPSASSLA